MLRVLLPNAPRFKRRENKGSGGNGGVKARFAKHCIFRANRFAIYLRPMHAIPLNLDLDLIRYEHYERIG